jgi:hypothetical protein
MTYSQYQQTQTNGINWVQGIEGAKAYPVAPNANVMLMDSSANTFYIKSADATGRPTISLYDYEERKVGNDTTTQNKTADFVTKEELYAILGGFVKKGESDEQSVQTTESDG